MLRKLFERKFFEKNFLHDHARYMTDALTSAYNFYFSSPNTPKNLKQNKFSINAKFVSFFWILNILLLVVWSISLNPMLIEHLRVDCNQNWLNFNKVCRENPLKNTWHCLEPGESSMRKIPINSIAYALFELYTLIFLAAANGFDAFLKQ